MPVTTPFAAFRDDVQAALLAAYPEHLARMGWDRERVRAHQAGALRALLGHAAERSPFHARRLAGIDLDAVDPDDLSALPVMTKSDVIAELDDVVTDRRLTRALVEETLAATGAEPRPLLGEYLAFASGGSSGQRGLFVHDRGGQVQFVASVSRGLVARIAAMGGPPPGGLPVAIVAAGSAVHLTGTPAALTANGALPFRYLPVPATLPVADIVARLNELAAPVLYGYPSMLARLVRAPGLRIAPVLVSCTGEMLTPALRATIRDGFGAPVVDGFACTEGLVGSTAPDGDVHVLAEDGCIVELVDAERRPVPPGERASAVLITVLHNRVQPLIRYELPDAFVAVPGDGALRVRIEGRSDAPFRYPDATVHPHTLRTVLLREPEVREYRVRQTERGVAVEIVSDRVLPGLAAGLGDALTAAGLSRPEVAVEVVAGIDRDVRSGKLRRFVPLG
jgi:phenylacetate-coenzyme A ligase PaaK-like adenylate-forming protein